jgi:hypothetical protein
MFRKQAHVPVLSTGYRKKNPNIKTANESFGNVPESKYFETILPHQNYMHGKIKRF